VAVHQDVRPHVDAYDLGDGRTVLQLAEGRVVNLVAAEGHPPEVMDLAFGIEALALAWLAETVLPGNTGLPRNTGLPGNTGLLGNTGELAVGVHEVPADIDAEAARLVLAATGTSIDELTPAQRAYLASWRIGSLPRRRARDAYRAAALTAPARAVAARPRPEPGSRWRARQAPGSSAAGSAAAIRPGRSGIRSSPSGWRAPA